MNWGGLAIGSIFVGLLFVLASHRRPTIAEIGWTLVIFGCVLAYWVGAAVPAGP